MTINEDKAIREFMELLADYGETSRIVLSKARELWNGADNDDFADAIAYLWRNFPRYFKDADNYRLDYRALYPYFGYYDLWVTWNGLENLFDCGGELYSNEPFNERLEVLDFNLTEDAITFLNALERAGLY
jgi:hypothetical protein